MRTVKIADHHAEMRAQGVSDRQHIAFKCPMCGTIQSMHTLVDAGVHPDKVVNVAGFSCEGRWRNAGPAARDRKPGKPGVRGCDWTLGGLFRLHEVEVDTGDGNMHPTFALATPEEAQALERDSKSELRSGGT